MFQYYFPAYLIHFIQIIGTYMTLGHLKQDMKIMI